jgi:hypothetical protein
MVVEGKTTATTATIPAPAMVDLLLNMQEHYSLWLTGLYQMGEVQTLSWQHCLSFARAP